MIEHRRPGPPPPRLAAAPARWQYPQHPPRRAAIMTSSKTCWFAGEPALRWHHSYTAA
jgi:hypothetical protein